MGNLADVVIPGMDKELKKCMTAAKTKGGTPESDCIYFFGYMAGVSIYSFLSLLTVLFLFSAICIRRACAACISALLMLMMIGAFIGQQWFQFEFRRNVRGKWLEPKQAIGLLLGSCIAHSLLLFYFVLCAIGLAGQIQAKKDVPPSKNAAFVIGDKGQLKKDGLLYGDDGSSTSGSVVVDKNNGAPINITNVNPYGPGQVQQAPAPPGYPYPYPIQQPASAQPVVQPIIVNSPAPQQPQYPPPPPPPVYAQPPPPVYAQPPPQQQHPYPQQPYPDDNRYETPGPRWRKVFLDRFRGGSPRSYKYPARDRRY